MDFSIIIPVLNERNKIAADIEAASAFLAATHAHSEIILVDDGSTDGTSAIARAATMPDNVDLTIIRHEQRHGKGHAVRTGILASTGSRIMFADSGSCVPFTFIHAGVRLLEEKNCQIANGSRKLPDSQIIRPQSLTRRVYSWLFRMFLIIVMGIPRRFSDTQCGFKIYAGDIGRELYAACVTDGFTFDVEVILRALQKDYPIAEFAIAWTADPDSRLGQTLSMAGILRELRNIKAALRQKQEPSGGDPEGPETAG
jgi:dolichyl-phosphate beta-glucosyltransferase